MIVCHKHEFIFIKTRKTAGTSIEIALSQFCGDEDIITTLSKEDEDIRKSLGYRGPQNFRIPFRYHKLAEYTFKDWIKVFLKQRPNPHIRRHADAKFIRPFIGEKIWNSYYKFCIERDPFDRAVSWYYFKTREMGHPPEINAYLQSNTQFMLSNWAKYTMNDQIVVDFVGRYERLNNDIADVTKRVGLPPLNLPNAKGAIRKNHQHYSQLLSTVTRTHIEKMCMHEIESLGYHWLDQNN